MKLQEIKIKIPVVKPRDPNQAILAAKKNAGGPMRDKKREQRQGVEKHKGRAYEDLDEGRRNVYGPGDEMLVSHPNELMQRIGKGDKVKVMTKSGVAKIEKVQFFNGGMMFKLDREVKLADGTKGAWVDPREVSLDLEKGAAPSAKEFAHRHAVGEEAVLEKWNDSGASDANGRWAKYAKGEISVKAMASWLIRSRVHKKTREEKVKSAMGAISQQQNTSKLISAKQADALRNAISPKD